MNRSIGGAFAAVLTGVAVLVCAPTAQALSLTDAAVFSSNADGGAYGGLIWNTAGNPPDAAGRWNLYFSSGPDLVNPVWLNGYDDSRTNLDIALAPGAYAFVVYANSAGNHDDHFTLSLYFDGNQVAPDISAAVPVNSAAFAVATGDNGLGLLQCNGACNYVPNAGALSFGDGTLIATLTGFSWFTYAADAPDFVWPHHHGVGYGGDGHSDFYGIVTLRVDTVNVPEPASLALFGAGLAGLAALRRGRRLRGRG